MRPSMKTLAVFGALVLAAGTLAVVSGGALRADDDDEEDAAAKAAQEKLAADELAKAVTRGKELWNSKELFKKSCASCHDDANKPNLALKTRTFSYPAYSRKAKGIVTLHQKIQEMVENQSRGARLDEKGKDIAALAAYVMSQRAAK